MRVPPLGHCDSVVEASHLDTLNNASRATLHINNFMIGKGALSVTRVKPGNRTKEKRREKLCSSPTGMGGIVTFGALTNLVMYCRLLLVSRVTRL